MIDKNALPDLATLPARALSKLSRRALIISITLCLLGGIALAIVVVRPAYRQFVQFRAEARSALTNRNRDLVRSAVEQSAGNMLRLLGAAEDAVRRVSDTVSRPPEKSTGHEILPLEPEFFPNGTLVGLLEQKVGYASPVSFDLPQIKTSDQADEIQLAKLWPSFLKTAKAIHSHHPELKWIFMGTGAGSFLVFPASPEIPPGYDPRSRDWYRQALTVNGPVWTSPYFTAGGNDLVLTTAQPVNTGVALSRAVVGADVVMADVVNNILTTPYCDRCAFYLINGSGQILGKKGDKVLGKTWVDPPQARFLADDLKEFIPADIAAAVFANILKTAATPTNEMPTLSRAPHGQWVDAVNSEYDFVSAPIESARWVLVGVVPRSYAGKDGEGVLALVDVLASHYRITLILALLGLGVFVALFVLVVFRLVRTILNESLKPTIEQFSNLAQNLETLRLAPTDKDSSLAPEQSLTKEHALVVDAVGRMQERLATEAKTREQLAVHAQLGQRAREIAHNMRSPLRALEMAIPALSNPLDKDLRILRGVVRDITDMAASLDAEGNKSDAKNTDAETLVKLPEAKRTTVLVTSEIETALSERRIALKGKTSVEIDREFGLDCYGLFADVEPTEFRSVLANLVNNAVEAIDRPGGRVLVFAGREDSKIVIKVKDDGKGITPEVLAVILEKGGSFGKPGGSGIGVSHARAAVMRWGGSLQIESTPGQGTSVTLTLPLAETPQWFAPSIYLPRGADVFVVDDDSSMREFWAYQLKTATEAKTKIQIFDKLEAFCAVWRERPATAEAPLILMDYEFRGEESTGLDVIEELAIADHAILVTGHFGDDAIIDRTKFLGVKVLPKPLVGLVPIVCGAQSQ